MRRIAASRRFSAPWWVAVAVLEIEPGELVKRELSDLRAHVTSGTTVARKVDVECGPITRDDGTATMEIHWHDATSSQVFPEMRGELQLIEIDDNETEIRLAGEYEPPLRTLGQIADATAGHRLAQRTLDDAVERLALRMETAVAAHVGMQHPTGEAEPRRNSER
jgi:hypothetical protein